ncbi:hypothetical protein AV530_011648 [Patagioenas fasciata monilis]|uniref:Uncharacterized protein n=1 Tax=Patagioenas fasciata monilis TaxID=372326 RepID=A0A1V4J5E2_PATFA|nr:hypothetical protein AV530_011648 [Patagioenas fasciata monilis]
MGSWRLLNCQDSCALSQKKRHLTSVRTEAHPHHTADQKSQAASLSPCPLLPPSPTLEIENLETARMRSLLCKE